MRMITDEVRKFVLLENYNERWTGIRGQVLGDIKKMQELPNYFFAEMDGYYLCLDRSKYKGGPLYLYCDHKSNLFVFDSDKEGYEKVRELSQEEYNFLKDNM